VFYNSLEEATRLSVSLEPFFSFSFSVSHSLSYSSLAETNMNGFPFVIDTDNNSFIPFEEQLNYNQYHNHHQQNPLGGGGFGVSSRDYFYSPPMGLVFGSEDENEEVEEEEEEEEDAVAYLDGNLNSTLSGMGSFNGHGGISGFSLEDMTKATTWQPTIAAARFAPRYRPSAPTCAACRSTSLHLRWDCTQIEDARFFLLEIAENLPTYQNNSMRVATKAALDVLAEDDEPTVDEDGFREIYRGEFAVSFELCFPHLISFHSHSHPYSYSIICRRCNRVCCARLRARNGVLLSRESDDK
jgi:hypothetical protein